MVQRTERLSAVRVSKMLKSSETGKVIRSFQNYFKMNTSIRYQQEITLPCPESVSLKSHQGFVLKHFSPVHDGR